MTLEQYLLDAAHHASSTDKYFKFNKAGFNGLLTGATTVDRVPIWEKITQQVRRTLNLDLVQPFNERLQHDILEIQHEMQELYHHEEEPLIERLTEMEQMVEARVNSYMDMENPYPGVVYFMPLAIKHLYLLNLKHVVSVELDHDHVSLHRDRYITVMEKYARFVDEASARSVAWRASQIQYEETRRLAEVLDHNQIYEIFYLGQDSHEPHRIEPKNIVIIDDAVTGYKVEKVHYGSSWPVEKGYKEWKMRLMQHILDNLVLAPSKYWVYTAPIPENGSPLFWAIQGDDQFFSNQDEEIGMMTNKGYDYHGINFVCPPATDGETIALYRAFNPVTQAHRAFTVEGENAPELEMPWESTTFVGFLYKEKQIGLSPVCEMISSNGAHQFLAIEESDVYYYSLNNWEKKAVLGYAYPVAKFRPLPFYPYHHKDQNAALNNDDLTLIEGIGPKVSSALKAAGFTSFQNIVDATPSELKAVLTAGGSKFNNASTDTWPEQAALAAAGNWDELEQLKEKLVGGRKV